MRTTHKLATVGLLTLLGVGIVAPVAAAAPNDGPIAATTANASLTHVRAKGGMCPEDFNLATVKGSHKVSWQYPSGKVGAKKVKSGQEVCVYKGQPGVWKDGVLVALPGNFPKNPTAQDIADLGLSKDTPVSPDLKIPQPKSGTYFQAPELADYVTPVGIVGVEDFEETYEVSSDGEMYTWKETRYAVQWEYRGGTGALSVSGPNGMTDYYQLNPDGAVIVTQYLAQNEEDTFDNGRLWLVDARSKTLPDYGQANLPPSAIQGWDFRDERDQNAVIGPSSWPSGKHAAPNFALGWDRDGTGAFDLQTLENITQAPPLYERGPQPY